MATFPQAPVFNETHSEGSITWRYDGYKWIKEPSTIHTDNVALLDSAYPAASLTATPRKLPSVPIDATTQFDVNKWFVDSLKEVDSHFDTTTGGFIAGIFVGENEPTEKEDGTLWFNSTVSSQQMFVYQASTTAWVASTNLTEVSASIAALESSQNAQDLLITGNTTGIETNSESILTNSGNITQNALDIAELEVTKGSVARYKVVDTVLGVAARPGELYTNSSNASLVTTMSFASVDGSSNATKPINDGDIIEFDFGNGVVRYVAGGSNANALPVTYADGQHTFSTNEEMDVYIYPQNKAGASKEYVDAADDLKYDKTGGFITGPVKVQVDSPSSQTCYAIYEPGGTRTYYIWNPGGLGGPIKHVCMDDSDFQITNTAIVDGVRKTVSPAISWLSEYHS